MLLKSARGLLATLAAVVTASALLAVGSPTKAGAEVVVPHGATHTVTPYVPPRAPEPSSPAPVAPAPDPDPATPAPPGEGVSAAASGVEAEPVPRRAPAAPASAVTSSPGNASTDDGTGPCAPVCAGAWGALFDVLFGGSLFGGAPAESLTVMAMTEQGDECADQPAWSFFDCGEEGGGGGGGGGSPSGAPAPDDSYYADSGDACADYGDCWDRWEPAEGGEGEEDGEPNEPDGKANGETESGPGTASPQPVDLPENGPHCGIGQLASGEKGGVGRVPGRTAATCEEPILIPNFRCDGQSDVTGCRRERPAPGLDELASKAPRCLRIRDAGRGLMAAQAWAKAFGVDGDPAVKQQAKEVNDSLLAEWRADDCEQILDLGGDM